MRCSPGHRTDSPARQSPAARRHPSGPSSQCKCIFLLGGELEALESLAACLTTFAEWIAHLSQQEIKHAKMQLLENWTHPMSYAKHVSTCTRKQETTFCSQNAWWGFSLSQIVSTGSGLGKWCIECQDWQGLSDNWVQPLLLYRWRN